MWYPVNRFFRVNILDIDIFRLFVEVEISAVVLNWLARRVPDMRMVWRFLVIVFWRRRHYDEGGNVYR